MAFPKKYAEFAARTRVPAGFAVLAAFLWFAQPTERSLAAGGSVALAGLAIRAWAAGHLEKNRRLATSGPYAHVRNPLYVGTLVCGLGFAVAGARWGVGAALVVFFLAWYLPVVEEEESHLAKILPGYGEYRRRVPSLIPSPRPRYSGSVPFRWSLYRRNREYHAAIAFAIALASLAVKAWRFPAL